jgi:hypothetical protein
MPDGTVAPASAEIVTVVVDWTLPAPRLTDAPESALVTDPPVAAVIVPVPGAGGAEGGAGAGGGVELPLPLLDELESVVPDDPEPDPLPVVVLEVPDELPALESVVPVVLEPVEPAELVEDVSVADVEPGSSEAAYSAKVSCPGATVVGAVSEGGAVSAAGVASGVGGGARGLASEAAGAVATVLEGICTGTPIVSTTTGAVRNGSCALGFGGTVRAAEWTSVITGTKWRTRFVFVIGKAFTCCVVVADGTSGASGARA